jgi:cob(I)alamin adenosyltransferase
LLRHDRYETSRWRSFFCTQAHKENSCLWQHALSTASRRQKLVSCSILKGGAAMEKGYIHIYEGDGKGKTTAAVGLAVRCAGSGQKVLFTQFLKGNSSSEIKALEWVPNLILYENTKEFGFSFHMDDAERKDAKNYYRNRFREIAYFAKRENVKMLVLDELLDAYNLKMVDQEEVCHFLRTRPEEMEVVLTGRDPAYELVQMAGYISHIEKVKHPFDWGVLARSGIEM